MDIQEEEQTDEHISTWIGEPIRQVNQEIEESEEIKKQKVFCIGDNKTGTTTLAQILINFGYKLPVQAIQEAHLTEQCFLGQFKNLEGFCDAYDTFQDLPFSQGVIYAILDYMYPQSKFILTVRDSNLWFESLVRFHLVGILKHAEVYDINDFKESTFKDKLIYLRENYLYKIAKKYAVLLNNDKIIYDWSLVYNKKHRINLYETRNREIIQYFQERQNQLLVIDITKEKDNSKIIEFLNIPKEYLGDIPHLNKSKI